MAGPRKRQIVELSDSFNQFRDKVNKIAEDAGATDQLTTTVDSDVVGAINEHDLELGTITSGAMGTTASTVETAIKEHEDQIGNESIQTIDSDSTTTISSALNQIHNELGDTSTMTVDATQVTDAINELDSDLGQRENLTVAANDVVAAINVHDAELGTITSGAMGTDAATVSDAIREHEDLLGNETIASIDSDAQTTVTGALNQLHADVGDVSTLTTTATHLTDAVNEHETDIGNMSLNTTAGNITAAINEHETDIGTVGNLTTTGNNLTLAVNEHDTELGNVAGITTVANTVAGAINELNAMSTDSVDEGSTNLYYTDERVDDRVNGLFQEGRGIDYSYNDGADQFTINLEYATSSNVGGASFDDGDFAVNGTGHVTVKAAGIDNNQLVNDHYTISSNGDSVGARFDIALGDTWNFNDGVGTKVTLGANVDDGTPNTVTISGTDATYTAKGVAKFTASDFNVSSGAVVIKPQGVSNTQIETPYLDFRDSDGHYGRIDLGNPINFVGNREQIVVEWDSSNNYMQIELDPLQVIVQNQLTVNGFLQAQGDFTVAGVTRSTGGFIELLTNVTGDSAVAPFYIPGLNAGIAAKRGQEDSAVFRWNEQYDHWETGFAGSTNHYTQIVTVNDSGLDALVSNSMLKNPTIGFGITNDSAQIALGGNVVFAGTANEVNVAHNNGTITYGLPDNVTVAQKVTATDLSILDSARVANDLSVGGDITLGGNLWVKGTTTTINSTTVEIADNVMLVNSNQTGTPATSMRSGLEVERGTATNVNLQWNELGDYWEAAYNGNNTKSEIFTHNNTTTDLTEGTNLYFTTTRARNSVSGTGNVEYNSTTGIISHKNTSALSGAYGQTSTEDGTYIKSLTVDADGHLTAVTSDDFDNRYDNYNGWDLYTGGTSRGRITTGENVDFVGGTNVAIAYTATNNKMTFSSTDTNTTYTSSVVGAQNAGDEILRLDPSSGSNSDIMLKGGTGVNIVRDSAKGLTINAEALVLYDFKAKTTSGTNADPYLALDPSSGVDKSVKIVGSSNVSVTRDSDRQISIASSFSNTTYDLTIPSGSTTLRLDPSAGNNDDIKLKGSGATSITRDSATGLTISSSNTNQLTTFVVRDGDGTSVTMGQGKYIRFIEGGGVDVNFTDTTPGTSGDPYDLTIKHVDTSSQASVNNSGRTYIQDITLDAYGHITGLTSATETVVNTDTNTNQLTTFVVEDGDGTERSIAHNKEWKFVEGNGININWTDTSSGTDADPYDLSFNVVTNQSLSIINSGGTILKTIWGFTADQG